MGKEHDMHKEAQTAVAEPPDEAADEASSAGPGDIAAQTHAAGADGGRELKEAQARAEQHWNDLLRARAEIANIQRRAERDLENAYKYSLEKFAHELIPVLDSLERGLEVASEANADVGKIREGTELTLKLMSAAVAKFGVKVVDPRGERFDPALHQAMSVQNVPGLEANRVVAVYQKGYLLNDRLIRPAMVVVSGSGGQPAGGGSESGA